MARYRQHTGPSNERYRLQRTTKFIATSEPGKDPSQISGPDALGAVKTAEVHVTHGEAWPNFHYDETTGEYKDVGRRAPYGGSQTLFDVKGPEIEYAAADKDMRHTVPTLLALALNKGGSSGAVPVRSSNDLSAHSAPLVRRAVKAGVIPSPVDPGERIAPTNNMSLRNRRFLPNPDEDLALYTDTSQTDLEEARGTVRNFLRRERNQSQPRTSPTYQKKPHQLSLFQFGE